MGSQGWRAAFCSPLLVCLVFWQLGSVGFVTGQKETGGTISNKKRLKEKNLLLAGFAQRTVIRAQPADSQLVHRVHPCTQPPPSPVSGSPQGDTLGLPVTPKAPTSPDAACGQVLTVTNGRAASCCCGLW